MIVICENCGKKYNFNPSNILYLSARFKCKACNHVITVQKQAPATPQIPDPQHRYLVDEVPLRESFVGADAPDNATVAIIEPGAVQPIQPPNETGFLGLRPKMLLLFLVVPLVAFSVVGVFLLEKMSRLASLMTDASTHSVTQSGEELIRTTARSVANQCRQYILAHPELTEKEMMVDTGLQRIAVQKVGLTGYTALYVVNPMVLLAHPNHQLLGKPVTETVRSSLGKDFDRWARLVEELDKGENVEKAGYYLWVDPDGILREKFMVATPLEGTKYGITSTIYMEEFLRPIRKVENEATQMTVGTRNYFLSSLAVVLLLIGLIVFIYSYRLTEKINILTAHAEQISAGDLDATLTMTSKDELGSLARAIVLMQDSIKIAIERLQKRR